MVMVMEPAPVRHAGSHCDRYLNLKFNVAQKARPVGSV